jgi:hypothetical protein
MPETPDKSSWDLLANHALLSLLYILVMFAYMMQTKNLNRSYCKSIANYAFFLFCMFR